MKDLPSVTQRPPIWGVSATRRCASLTLDDQPGRPSMILRIALVAGVISFAATAGAAEKWDPFTLPYQNPDLKFPDQPQSFAPGREIKMFKPDGAGPFPALVIMPGCYGQTYSMHTF